MIKLEFNLDVFKKYKNAMNIKFYKIKKITNNNCKKFSHRKRIHLNC